MTSPSNLFYHLSSVASWVPVGISFTRKRGTGFGEYSHFEDHDEGAEDGRDDVESVTSPQVQSSLARKRGGSASDGAGGSGVGYVSEPSLF